MKKHTFDGISFFSGLVIAIIGTLFLIAGSPGDIVDAVARLGNWFWPIVFLVGGAAILIPIFASGRRGEEEEPASD